MEVEPAFACSSPGWVEEAEGLQDQSTETRAELV